MINKEFVETFVESINKLAHYPFYRINKLPGRFVFKENNYGPAGVSLSLDYLEKDKILCVIRRKYSAGNFFKLDEHIEELYNQFYYDMLKSLFLTIDCTAKSSSQDGVPVHFLSFSTIINEGLKKLQKTDANLHQKQ